MPLVCTFDGSHHQWSPQSCGLLLPGGNLAFADSPPLFPAPSQHHSCGRHLILFPISFQHTGELLLFHWNPAQAVTPSLRSLLLPSQGVGGAPCRPHCCSGGSSKRMGAPTLQPISGPCPLTSLPALPTALGTHSDRNSNQVRFEAAPPGQTDKRALCRALQGQRGQTPGLAALPLTPRSPLICPSLLGLRGQACSP